MDKLKEIQTQINLHTMENIHTMLGNICIFLQPFCIQFWGHWT